MAQKGTETFYQERKILTDGKDNFNNG